MRVSFTGTQVGYNSYQEEQLAQFLKEHKNRMTIAVHGCCVGADIQFHHLVRKICGKSVFIAVLPSTAKTRAPIPEDADYVADREPPLVRNKKIVDMGYDTLLATPRLMHEELRSGTWHAIRYSKKRSIPYKIFWPKPQSPSGAV